MLKQNNILHLTRRENHVNLPYYNQIHSPPTSPLPPIPLSPKKSIQKKIYNVTQKSPIRLMNLVSDALLPRKQKKNKFNEMFQSTLNTKRNFSNIDTNLSEFQHSLLRKPIDDTTEMRFSLDSEEQGIVNLYNQNSVYTNCSSDSIQYSDIEPAVFCILCQKNSIECDTSMVLLECMHCIHVNCFINNITKNGMQNTCAKCSSKIDTDDIKTIFNKYLKNSKLENDKQMSEISKINSDINTMTSFVKELYIKYEDYQKHDKHMKDLFLHLVT
jgi:hypothetical protein